MADTPHEDLLQDALAAFRNATGLAAELYPPILDGPLGPDGRIRIRWQETERNFAVQVKPRLTLPAAGMAAEKMAAYGDPTILVARYVNPNLADRLREQEVFFIDTAGNAFIRDVPLMVFIKGAKPQPDANKNLFPAGRAFRPKGLQIVFAMLCLPGLENKPFREIAENANVALGTVNLVFADLKAKGFLLDMGKRGRMLVKKEKLLTRWVEAYAEDLRPKLHRWRYTAENRDWWGTPGIAQQDALWGGEVAAGALTGYLRPEKATLYAGGALGKLVLQHRLRKDPDGNLQVLQKFWKFDIHWNFHHLVPPLLIYADLMATGNARNIETARMVYDQYLAGLVQEN